MAGMEALGRLLDLSVAVTPQDISAGAVTGTRCSFKNATGMTVLVFKGAGGVANTDPQITFKSADASSGGNVDTTTVTVGWYYKKSATSYTGAQTWTKVTLGSAVANPTISGEGSSAGLYAFEIPVTSMPDGYPYLEVDTAKAGTNAQIAGVLYIPHDLEVQRTPANLSSQNA